MPIFQSPLKAFVDFSDRDVFDLASSAEIDANSASGSSNNGIGPRVSCNSLLEFSIYDSGAFDPAANDDDSDAGPRMANTANAVVTAAPIKLALSFDLISRTDAGASGLPWTAGLTAQSTESSSSRSIANEGTWAAYAVALVPTDDLFDEQWHLENTGQSGGISGIDLNVTDVWDDYTGQGVTVGVWDDGVQYTHPDLDDNYDTSLHIVVNGVTHDPLPQNVQSAHGTSVAGVIASENNGQGTVGAAYDAMLVGIDIFYDPSLDFEASFSELDNFDVNNHSWGWVNPFADSIYDTNATGGTDWVEFFGGILESVETGRDGLGSINLVANGNARKSGRDGNDSNFNNIPETIAVGATSHDGYVSYYSTPGANLLISAPSNGADGAGIYTTDRTGSSGYESGAYTSSFGGTSSATPAAAGVVALMLEANDQLGWRDVQDILAYTARHTGSDIGAGPEADELYTWEFNGASTWNGGGFHFSNDYGFGLIDAGAAVRLAETWTDQKTSSSWQNPIVASDTFNISVPDNNATGISINFETTANFEIENVGLTLSFTGGYTGDYRVILTSPDGTLSTLSVPFNSGNASTDSWFYMSNAFRGETSAGTWTINIADEWAQDTSIATYAELQFFGETADADDLYVYTDEFSDFVGDGNHLPTLEDLNGGTDTLNAAAVTSNTTVKLGATATIDGQVISSVTGIENVYSGDGKDKLRGDSESNLLSGGRGNDKLIGKRGADTLQDGEGRDVMKGQRGADVFDLIIDSSEDIILGFRNNDTIRLAEGDLEFAGLTFTDLGVGRVRIEYGGDSVLVIDRSGGLTTSDFDASDFIFV